MTGATGVWFVWSVFCAIGAGAGGANATVVVVVVAAIVVEVDVVVDPPATVVGALVVEVVVVDAIVPLDAEPVGGTTAFAPGDPLRTADLTAAKYASPG